MQLKTYPNLFKNIFLHIALTFSFGTSSLQAGQYTYSTPADSTGKIFTMLTVDNTISDLASNPPSVNKSILPSSKQYGEY